MRKLLMILFLFLLSCSALDEDRFFRRAIGSYILNEDGVLFFRRSLGITDFNIGTTLEFRGNGQLLAILSPTTAVDLAQFLELRRADEGTFRLAGTNAFVAMGFISASPLPFWISSTNTFPTADDVLFEHTLPIAQRVGS